MTAETVLRGILLEIGLEEENAQLTSNSYEIRQILQFMNAAGRDVARRAEWSRLYRTLNVAGPASSAPLPADFHEISEFGAVRLNKAGFQTVRAIVSPEQWEFLLARPSVQPYYHLAQGNILFSPALDSAGARVRYVSRNWVDDKNEITENGDTLLIPERLVEKGAIWRWKRQKGLPFDDYQAEFEADIETEIKADRGQG